jgi:hypothetical protein
MRAKSLVVGLVAGAVVAIPVAGFATGGGPRGASRASDAGRQAVQRSIGVDHTTSRKWISVYPRGVVAPQSGLVLRASGLITLTLTGDFTGGPIQLRVLDSGTVMRPGTITFTPSANDTSFSYTFGHSANKRVCGRALRVQWRSVTGTTVTLRHAAVVATYMPAQHDAKVCT